MIKIEERFSKQSIRHVTNENDFGCVAQITRIHHNPNETCNEALMFIQ